MDDIKIRYNQEIEAESKIRALLNEDKIRSIKNACDVLWYKYEIFSVYNLILNDIDAFKLNCYINGRLDEYRIKIFNDRLFDYGLNHITYALLSDSEDLIDSYSKMRYYKAENAEMSMDEMVDAGHSAIWVNTIQSFIINDTKRVEENLDILETKVLKKLSKQEETLRYDYEFYKALLHGKKDKMEEVLENLTSSEIHKKRNNDSLLNKYISVPAIGYAKLAWMKGINITTNTPLIPNTILTVKPLKNYDTPYSFLNDY